MINLFLEFKTWLEAYEFRCKSKSKHFARIEKMITYDSSFNKEFEKLNEKILNNLKYYVSKNLESSNNFIDKNFVEFANNNFENAFIPKLILKQISYKTTLGRDFKDFCEMDPVEVLNSIYIISSVMAQKEDVLNEFFAKTLSEFYGQQNSNVKPEDILKKTISNFLINPRDMVKGYSPDFKEIFRKEEKATSKDLTNVEKPDDENQIDQIDDDPYDSMSFHKKYLEELLTIDINDVKNDLKNEINSSFNKQCFRKEEIIEFHQYLNVKRTPEKFSNLKICFYIKFMKDGFDKIVTDAIISPSDLDIYTNNFMIEFKKENHLEEYEESMAKDVVNYFYESSSSVYTKLLKILLGCKALEIANVKTKNRQKPICGFIMIWLRSKFPNSGLFTDLEMKTVNNKMFNAVSKAITGKELTDYCYFKEIEEKIL